MTDGTSDILEVFGLASSKLTYIVIIFRVFSFCTSMLDL